MKRRTINYVGWLGHDNIGDEALYLVSQKIFSPHRLVPYNAKSSNRITIFVATQFFRVGASSLSLQSTIMLLE